MSTGRDPQKKPSNQGYTLVTDVPPDIPWPVYETVGEGPSVLLLHDVLGPRPQCVELGRNIRDMGYHVYVPVIFGEFGHTCSTLGGFVSSSGAGWIFTGGETNPGALLKLNALCTFLSTQRHHKPIVVVGNCMSGGAAIALLANPHVCGAVASQPAFPYFPASAFDMAPDTLKEAKKRAADLPQPALLAFRFHRDIVCREPRFQRLLREFGDHFDGVELCEKGEEKELSPGLRSIPTVDSTQHSVLIPLEKETSQKKNECSHKEALQNLQRYLRLHAVP